MDQVQIKPQKVTDLQIVFPAGLGTLMPKWEDIPEEFKDSYGPNPWVRLAAKWFYEGVDGYFVANKNIDISDATRHLKVLQASREFKHEHKEAAVAYLMSLWFEKFIEKKPK